MQRLEFPSDDRLLLRTKRVFYHCPMSWAQKQILNNQCSCISVSTASCRKSTDWRSDALLNTMDALAFHTHINASLQSHTWFCNCAPWCNGNSSTGGKLKLNIRPRTTQRLGLWDPGMKAATRLHGACLICLHCRRWIPYVAHSFERSLFNDNDCLCPLIQNYIVRWSNNTKKISWLWREAGI